MSRSETCEHGPNEDCLICAVCGQCSESLNEEDVCAGCVEEAKNEPARPAP